MNEKIIGIEVSGEIYPIKDEETSGKAQTLETKVSIAETNIANLETALTGQGGRLAQIETNIGETDIQELKSLVDTHEEEIKELKVGITVKRHTDSRYSQTTSNYTILEETSKKRIILNAFYDYDANVIVSAYFINNNQLRWRITAGNINEGHNVIIDYGEISN